MTGKKYLDGDRRSWLEPKETTVKQDDEKPTARTVAFRETPLLPPLLPDPDRELVPFEGVPHDRLEEWRRTYSNRRTVNHQLLRDAEALITAGVAEAAAWYGGQVAAERRRADVLAESLVAAREEKDKALLELYRGREIREHTSSHDDPGLVTLSVGKGIPGWTIADLEETAYRLRAAGGEDETPVKMTDKYAQAIVPAPSLVPMGPRRVAPAAAEHRQVEPASRESAGIYRTELRPVYLAIAWLADHARLTGSAALIALLGLLIVLVDVPFVPFV